MDKGESELVEELLSDIEGLQQLASWQLALARQVGGRLAELRAAGAKPTGGRTSRRRGRKRPGEP